MFRVSMLCLLFFLLANSTVSAQGSIQLSEVFPAPSTGTEWIELINTSSNPIDISGWQLYDQLATPSLLHTFPSGSLIAANELVVAETNQKLNNAADGVVLKDQASNEVDSFNYTTSTTDLSWSRNPEHPTQWNLLPPTKGAFNAVPTPSPTPSPSSLPSTPAPTPTPSTTPSTTPSPSPSANPTAVLSAIEVSEIMACPSQGDTEWIELFNPTDGDYVLNQWLVKDADNHTKTISGLLPAQQLAVFRWSGSLLNNAGDQLQLLQPDGVTRATVSLPPCKSGQSWILSGDTWQLTTSTPGETNTAPTTTSQILGLETTFDASALEESLSPPLTSTFEEPPEEISSLIAPPPNRLKSPISATDSSWPLFAAQSSHQDLSTKAPRLSFTTKKLPTALAINAIISSWFLISVGSINLYENYLAGKIPTLAHLAQRLSTTFGMGDVYFQFFSPKRPP